MCEHMYKCRHVCTYVHMCVHLPKPKFINFTDKSTVKCTSAAVIGYCPTCPVTSIRLWRTAEFGAILTFLTYG